MLARSFLRLRRANSRGSAPTPRLPPGPPFEMPAPPRRVSPQPCFAFASRRSSSRREDSCVSCRASLVTTVNIGSKLHIECVQICCVSLCIIRNQIERWFRGKPRHASAATARCGSGRSSARRRWAGHLIGERIYMCQSFFTCYY